MPSPAARVLVIEDEETLRSAVGQALHTAGFTVQTAANGSDFDRRLAGFRPDAAVLDISLPGEDGLQLAGRLRQASDAAVLFLTARDAISDRLASFDAGGDDYIVKPFALAELIARLTAVLRRTGRLSLPSR